MKSDTLVMLAGLGIAGYLLYTLLSGQQTTGGSGTYGSPGGLTNVVPTVTPSTIGPPASGGTGMPQGNKYTGGALLVTAGKTQAVLLQNPKYPSSNIRAVGYLQRQGVATTTVGSTVRITGTNVGVIQSSASTSVNPQYQPGKIAQQKYGMGR